MNCHLTPVFHLAEHNEEVMLQYGPVYGWWGYPMEQNNGFLKKFRTNGHTGGELEATLMRSWVKYGLISDLVGPQTAVSLILSPSYVAQQILRLEHMDEPDELDIKITEDLKTYLGRGPKGTRRRGNMMSLMAALDEERGARPLSNVPQNVLIF